MTYTRMRSFSISLLPQRISLLFKSPKSAFRLCSHSIRIRSTKYLHRLLWLHTQNELHWGTMQLFFFSLTFCFFHANERPNYFIETFTTHARKITIKIEAFYLSATSLCDVVALGRPIKKNYTKIHSLRDLYLFYIVSSFLFGEIINLISIFWAKKKNKFDY